MPVTLAKRRGTMSRKKSWSIFWAVAMVLICFGASISARATPITPSAGFKNLGHLKKFYSIPNFKIGGAYEFGNESAYEFGGKGGVTLESLGAKPLRVAYIDVGTPKRDSSGKIINAVIINSYYSGDSTHMYNYWYDGQPWNRRSKGAVVGPGKLIDTNKYYVIFLDALGLWGASKPSDGLGLKFPQYSYSDYVQANYRLLKDALGVAKVKLATGVSMGASQTYLWAILHPDYVEAIMPIGTSPAFNPVAAWLQQLMIAAFKSDPAWRETNGDYYHLPKEKHPNKGLMFGFSIMTQSGLSFAYTAKQSWDNVKKNVFYWNPKGQESASLIKRARVYDVIDLMFRNKSGRDFSNELHRIKAKTLILHVKNDQFIPVILADKAAKKIAGAKLFTYESPLSHYACPQAPHARKEEVLSFFKEIGMK